MARVAFLGLGNMGIGMAGRLLAAGHELSVWNRTAERAAQLEAKGAKRADSPAEAAAGTEAIFAMLSDDVASREVWLGSDGALSAAAEGAFAIECSTLSAGWVAELAGHAAAEGLRYLDCPVTGLPDAAAAGQLTLLIGAGADDLANATPLLAPLSVDRIHFGAIGTGTAYKLIVNLMGAVQIAGVAEGMAMAEHAGLDSALVAEALAKGQAASPQVVRTANKIVADEHDANILFAGRLRLKDADYGARLAANLGLAAPLGETAVALYREQVAAGWGDCNDSAIVRVLRRSKSN